MKKLLLIFLLSLSCHATDLNKIYEVIKYVESDHRTYIVGDGGRAYGVVQIHKICVADINRIYKTNYKHIDAFNPEKAKKMFMLYISAGIKLYKKKYCRSPTEEDIVRMWNGGIYTGYNKKSTVKYYNRYLKFKRLLYE